LKHFIKESGGADKYANLKVKYISGHNPDLVLYDDDDNEIERIDLKKYDNESSPFVQCPIYAWLNSKVYNKSYQMSERFVVNEFALHTIADSCMQYFDRIRHKWPRAKLFLLGFLYPPGWVRTAIHVPNLFAAVNKRFEITCKNHTFVIPIDRYNLVGNRTRDCIHPTFETQHTLVRTIIYFLYK